MRIKCKLSWIIFAACISVVIVNALICPVQAFCMEEGQPEEGVNWVDGVSPDGRSFLIDEYRYQLTSTTGFYTQNGEITSPERFVEGLLVEFKADEQGGLLSLREEFDVEGEYAKRRSGDQAQVPSVTQKALPQKKQKIIQSGGVRSENGVWKN